MTSMSGARFAAVSEHARAVREIPTGMLGHVDPRTALEAYAVRAAGDEHGSRSADEVLRLSLARLEEDVRSRLIGIARAHAAAVVTSVSPLAVDVCASEGLDLDAVAEALRPDTGWRDWLGGAPKGAWLRTPWGSSVPWRSRASFGPGRVRLSTIVREDEHPQGALGFRVEGRVLGMGMEIGSSRVATFGGRAVLTIPGLISDAMIAALRGRLLADVVDNSLLAGRGYRIRGARHTHDGRTSITFEALPIRWRMPWARIGTRPDVRGSDDRSGA